MTVTAEITVQSNLYNEFSLCLNNGLALPTELENAIQQIWR